MKRLRVNLLVQFSIASLFVVATLAVVISLMLTARLDRNVELLEQHGAAMMKGNMIKPGDPFSIPSLSEDVKDLRTLTFVAMGGGFIVLYVALVGIVWNGWRTITRQRKELQTANVHLEDTVAERVAEIRRTNERLQGEIGERSFAEKLLQASNAHLESTLGELRRTQQQVVHQERMRALGQMASGVAHDFNNALSPIVGYADLLLLSPESLDDKEATRSYLEIMRNSAQDGANVVRRLREFYRPPDEAQLRESASVYEVVQQVVSATRPRWKDQAQADGIKIEIETDLGEVPLVAANPADIRDVLTNLVINAADAMPDGGTITVGSRHAGEHAVLRLSDTGTGMSEEVRQRCMDPFFSTKGERGTGMGLAMVFGIIQRNFGTTEIESEEGKGTTFTIRIPLQSADVSGDGDDSEAVGKATRSLNVLAVDDDSTGLGMVAAMLRTDGHTVDTAANGREGLEKFRDGKYDVVVTDRAMPEMNGDDLAGAIREVVPLQPVIMLTGFGEIMQGASERPAGVDVVVSKPITVTALREAVAEATGVSTAGVRPGTGL